MFLPEGIERENNKMYEEVQIPHTEPMPIGIEEKIVYIKDLDEVRKFNFNSCDRINKHLLLFGLQSCYWNNAM